MPATPKSITPPAASATASGEWWKGPTAKTATPVQTTLSSLPATTPTFTPDFSSYTPTTTPTANAFVGNKIGGSQSNSSPNLMSQYNSLSHSAPITPTPYPISPILVPIAPLSISQNVTSANSIKQYPPPNHLSLSMSSFNQPGTMTALSPTNISNLSSSGSYGLMRAVSSSSVGSNSAPSTPKLVSSSSSSNIPNVIPLHPQNMGAFQPHFSQQPILQPQVLQPQAFNPHMTTAPVLPVQNFAPQNYPGPQNFGQPQLSFQPNFQQFPAANLQHQQQYQAQQKLVDDRFGDAFL